jgi:hypothetical protein
MRQTITGFLMNIIPTTLLSPFVEGNILQVLFVADPVRHRPGHGGRARRAGAELPGRR